MLKLCGKPICKPLDIIFQSCIKHGKFPAKWKKTNVFPVDKKVTGRFKKTLDLYLYFRFEGKSLNAYCINDFMNISLRMS